MTNLSPPAPLSEPSGLYSVHVYITAHCSVPSCYSSLLHTSRVHCSLSYEQLGSGRCRHHFLLVSSFSFFLLADGHCLWAREQHAPETADLSTGTWMLQEQLPENTSGLSCPWGETETLCARSLVQKGRVCYGRSQCGVTNQAVCQSLKNPTGGLRLHILCDYFYFVFVSFLNGTQLMWAVQLCQSHHHDPGRVTPSSS